MSTPQLKLRRGDVILIPAVVQYSPNAGDTEIHIKTVFSADINEARLIRRHFSVGETVRYSSPQADETHGIGVVLGVDGDDVWVSFDGKKETIRSTYLEIDVREPSERTEVEPDVAIVQQDAC